MKVLRTLKHLINFFFFAYIIAACLWVIPPLYGAGESDFITVLNSMMSSEAGGLINRAEGPEYWFFLIWFLANIGLFFTIIFYLRKFVLNSVVGDTFDKSTRKYLRRAGVVSVIYSLLSLLLSLSGRLQFFWSGGADFVSLFTFDFLGLGSPYFTTLMGLFFIYLSKVLELSESIQQENLLTI